MIPLPWACLGSAMLGAAACWQVMTWRTDAAEGRAATDAAAKVIQAADVVADAASRARGDIDTARARLSTIAREARQHAQAAPLPADCRPDAERIRLRNEAIDAYNRAAGSESGGPVSDD